MDLPYLTNTQDPDDLEICRKDGFSGSQVYLWEPTGESFERRSWAMGAWRVTNPNYSPDGVVFWGPASNLYGKEEGATFTYRMTLQSFIRSIPGSSTPDRRRKVPYDSIVPLAEHEERDEENVCESCAKIPFRLLLLSDKSYKLCDGVAHLNTDSCRLCRVIFGGIRDSSRSNNEEITLSVKPAHGLLSPRLVIRAGSQPHKQVSLPILYQPGSREYFLLLQKWLDESGGSRGREEDRPKRLPTRLIHITRSEDGFKLRLITAENLSPTLSYIALSHRWGGIDAFCTTGDNFRQRCMGFDYSELPKTFQHAVLTTWNLGVNYLWIDSLCIIQHLDDDWRHESARMQNVFYGALCILAATSSKDCNQGFLGRSPESSIRLTDSGSNPPLPVYIKETEHDFDKDVAQGPLNKRAWVFQERILSRRTIHFSAAETYFECRSSIWCESLGLEQPSESPLQRLQLQMFGPKTSHQMEESLFMECFSKYSTLDITNCTDRPSGLLGLESRLAESYESASLYGIILSFFYSSLFWHRSGGERMKIIDFKTESVPSWSWMAYEGTINYGFIPGSFSGSLQLHPLGNGKDEIKLTNAGTVVPIQRSSFLLIASLYQVQGSCVMEPDENSNCRITDGDLFLGWIRYDGPDEKDSTDLLCIRVARFTAGKEDVAGSGELDPSDFVAILLVMPTYRDGKHVHKTYQRVGAGMVRQGSLVQDEQGSVWVA